MSNDDGGRVIPDAFIDQLIATGTQPSPFRSWYEPVPRRPLTWRQKARIRWYDLKWAVHDRIFGAHSEYDE